jgi:predicted ATP-grasp superfamily ATP-dependent carboligase
LRTETPVVVIYRTGAGALGVARTLGRLGVPVHLVMQEGMSTPLTRSRYWRRIVSWDFDRPEADSIAFLKTLPERFETAERPLLLTLVDWVAVLIERHADSLSDAYVFPRASQPVVGRLADKWGMAGLAHEVGIPTPLTARPSTPEAALEFTRTVGFPVVLKPSDPFAAFVPEKQIIHSERELIIELDRQVAIGGTPFNFVLQEYVPGEADSVWMCNAYFGLDGRCRAVFTGQKLRQVSPTGVASLAVCRENETVAEQTRAFMEGVGYRGCVGIGYRYDARDGLYKVLDVNARVSGIFRLFAGTNEMDVVRGCYLDLTGQRIPETQLQPGRKWMLDEDVLVALRAIRERKLSLSEWARSVRGVRESQWFARDDPMPFVKLVGGGIRSWIAPASQP